MNRLSPLLLLPLVLTVLLAGCHRLKPEALLSGVTGTKTLRVGIAADAPPLAYKKDGNITGLETKFAAGLAQSLDKPLELVELPRQALTQALLDKKIDIIMSGLTAASGRNQKLAFTEPYLISGQTPLVHLDAHQQLSNDSRNLTEKNVRLGVVAGTAGDIFIKWLKPKGKTTRFNSAPEGVQALIDNTIDAFIYDLPANCYYASLYVDKGLTPGTTPMTREALAWGVRPNDPEMLKAANAYLAALEKSGELQNQLAQSLPFYRNTAYSPEK